MAESDIYLREGELAKLMTETMGKTDPETGGQAVVPLAFPSMRLLTNRHGEYPRWILEKLAEYRGVTV